MSESEPKSALQRAASNFGPASAQASLLFAAWCYADERPEWFDLWGHWEFQANALTDAAEKASESGDEVASHVLYAAAALMHPELFGGAS